MTTQNDPTLEGTAGATANGAASTGQQQVIDWESSANPYKEYATRFKGLQPKYQELTTAHDKLGLKVTDLEEKNRKLTGDYEAKVAELNTLTGKHAQATTESTAMQAKYARLQTVMAKFPDLLPFLGDGKDQPDLLPTGEGETLEKGLAAFRDVMKQQGASAARELVQGSTSTTTTATTTPSDTKPKAKSDLLQLALKASREGKKDEYEHYYDEYLKAS